MIGLVQFDFGTPEIGQPRGRAERQRFEFGMGGVDDFGAEVDGVGFFIVSSRNQGD